MNGLLYLKKGMQLEMNTRRGKRDTTTFECKDVILFENGNNYHSTRYLLANEKETYLLDVQKDDMRNISLTCYHLIEEMDFDLNFLSLVGTSPLGYHNPTIPNIDYILYEKMEKQHQENEMLKFMVTKEEVPKDPKEAEELGYHQDGNGNWYFMTDRTKGSLLKFEDDYKLSWEYKQEKDERLLIEMKAYTNMTDYIHKQPTIYIYEGKSLHRRDIKILKEEKVLESA